jgi:hypothetical protein
MNLQFSTGNVNPIEFQIIELDAPMSMPFVLNQVSTDNTNGERAVRASVNGGTGAITKQSGSWLTFVSHPSAGNYNYTISPAFSDQPGCVCTNLDASARTCQVSALSTSTLSVAIGLPGSANEDHSFSLICIGPK